MTPKTFKESVEEYINSKNIELFAAQVDKACIEDDYKKTRFLPDQNERQTKIMLGAAQAKEQMCLRQLAKAREILEAQNA